MHNIWGVEPMEVCNMKVAKEINSSHNVIFYNSPTLFEEHPYESIRSVCLVAWPLHDGIPHLLLGKEALKVSQIVALEV